jgi:hypothetical protein
MNENRTALRRNALSEPLTLRDGITLFPQFRATNLLTQRSRQHPRQHIVGARMPGVASVRIRARKDGTTYYAVLYRHAAIALAVPTAPISSRKRRACFSSGKDVLVCLPEERPSYCGVSTCWTVLK